MAGAKKWNMVIDLALCNDCNCCFMADKDEFTGNDWLPFSKAQPWEGAPLDGDRAQGARAVPADPGGPPAFALHALRRRPLRRRPRRPAPSTSGKTAS